MPTKELKQLVTPIKIGETWTAVLKDPPKAQNM